MPTVEWLKTFAEDAKSELLKLNEEEHYLKPKRSKIVTKSLIIAKHQKLKIDKSSLKLQKTR